MTCNVNFINEQDKNIFDCFTCEDVPTKYLHKSTN